MMRGTRIRYMLGVVDKGRGANKRWPFYDAERWCKKHGLVLATCGPEPILALTPRGVEALRIAIAEHEQRGTGWVVSGNMPPNSRPANYVLLFKVGRSWYETESRVSNT